MAANIEQDRSIIIQQGKNAVLAAFAGIGARSKSVDSTTQCIIE